MEPKLEAIQKLISHVHNNNYAGFLVSGHTNTVTESLLQDNWKIQYPSETMPPVFSFDGEANTILYKKDMSEETRVKEAQSIITRSFPNLNAHKDDKLCYVDETINSGYKYERLKDIFKKLGFNHVDFAFFAGMENHEYDNEVFIGVKDDELTGRFVIESLAIHGYESDVNKVLPKNALR